MIPTNAMLRSPFAVNGAINVAQHVLTALERGAA